MSSAGALDPAPPRTSWSSLPGKPLRTRGGCSYDSRRQPPFVGAPASGANTGHPVSANAPRSQRDKGGGVVERPLDDNAAAGPDSCRRSAGALHPVSPRTSWCSSLPGTPLFAPGAGAPTAADASPFCRSTRLGCEHRPSPWRRRNPATPSQRSREDSFCRSTRPGCEAAAPANRGIKSRVRA